MEKIWEKIKAFFENKTVQIIEVIIIVLCAIGLVIGGKEVEGLKQILDYTSAFIFSVIALYKIIYKIIMGK